MSELRFDDEVLKNAITCYQLRTDEPLDEVVLACLCELKESRQILQKIEQLYEPKSFGEGISREERDKEVQKILKGE